MYLVFDIETTGLPKNIHTSTRDSNSWPYLVQLSYLLYNLGGNEEASVNHIIKPEGYTIPERVVPLHGITQERAEREGLPVVDVLHEFLDYAQRATTFIAYNIKFDEKVLRAEFHRHNLPNVFFDKNRVCMMLGSRKVCQLPTWPTLRDLYFHLFRTPLQGAHDALVDATATAKCFWECKRRGLI